MCFKSYLNLGQFLEAVLLRIALLVHITSKTCMESGVSYRTIRSLLKFTNVIIGLYSLYMSMAYIDYRCAIEVNTWKLHLR